MTFVRRERRHLWDRRLTCQRAPNRCRCPHNRLPRAHHLVTLCWARTVKERKVNLTMLRRVSLALCQGYTPASSCCRLPLLLPRCHCLCRAKWTNWSIVFLNLSALWPHLLMRLTLLRTFWKCRCAQKDEARPTRLPQTLRPREKSRMPLLPTSTPLDR